MLLKNVNFSLDLGQKVGIIGGVGSGKTSLLMAILGEIPVKEGSIYTQPDTVVSYAEQEPLIVSGTVQ